MRKHYLRKLRQRYTVDPDTGCWLWQHNHDKKGRARMHYQAGSYITNSASRVAYIVFNDIDPRSIRGQHVLHSCSNGDSCINPDHLYLGSDTDNRIDSSRAGTHPTRKLTDSQVLEARRRYIPWKVPYRQLAEEMGVSVPTIMSAVKGETFQWLSDHTEVSGES